MAVRGCGSRVVGGVYLEVKLSPFGKPLDYFIMDPPQPVDTAAMGLSEIGVKVITDPNGVSHVMDWVGAAYYPNVQDFVEETRTFGVSRRVSSRFDFSVLTPESKLLLVHRKAIIRDPAPYWEAAAVMSGSVNPISVGHVHCASAARGDDDHCAEAFLKSKPMCSGLWQHDVEDGVAPANHSAERNVLREVGDTSYYAWRRPDNVEPQYEPGIFLALPISNIAVINDPQDTEKIGSLADRIAQMLADRIPVSVEDE